MSMQFRGVCSRRSMRTGCTVHFRTIGINSAIDLVSTYAARVDQMRPWLADAQINRDKNLRLQYLAGFGLNLYEQASIYAEMIQGAAVSGGVVHGVAGDDFGHSCEVAVTERSTRWERREFEGNYGVSDSVLRSRSREHGVPAREPCQ